MVPALRGIAGPPCVPRLFIFADMSVLRYFLLPVPLIGRKALADLLGWWYDMAPVVCDRYEVRYVVPTGLH